MEKTTKITKRDMLTDIIDLISGVEKAYDKDAMIAYAENEIALLDKRAERSREAAAKKREEGDALTAAVEAVLTDEYEPIAEIAAKVVCDEVDEVTVGMTQYRLNALVKAGKADKAEIIWGESKRKVVGFKRV